jgi:ABC-type Fe3+-hydroxamate transport system substrate-binding protein
MKGSIMGRKFFLLVFSLFTVALISGCARQVVVAEVLQQPVKGKIYTKYNIWYKNPENIYCLNVQQGKIIPLGTEIKPVKATTKDITFKTADGYTFTIDFDEQLMMIPMQGYIKQTFTLTPPAELTKGIKPDVLEKIRRGMVTPGMTKLEVILAYGPPAAFRTPTEKNSTWIYWIEQDKTIRVVFKGDKVKTILNLNE